MKKYLFLIVILLIGFTSANVHYHIYPEGTLVEYSFDSYEDLEIKIPYDAKDIESNKEYTQNEDIIYFNEGVDLKFSYVTKSLVDKSDGEFYFTSFVWNIFYWSFRDKSEKI